MDELYQTENLIPQLKKKKIVINQLLENKLNHFFYKSWPNIYDNIILLNSASDTVVHQMKRPQFNTITVTSL